jgi:hypothetical protein
VLAQVAGEVQGFIERKTLGGQRVGLYWSKGPCPGPNLGKFIAEGIKTVCKDLLNFFSFKKFYL